jgi:hypothetical protein
MGKKEVRKVNIQELKSFEGYKQRYDDDKKSYFISKHLLSRKQRDLGVKEILQVEELAGDYYIIHFLNCPREVNLVPREICKKIEFFYWSKMLYLKITKLDDTVVFYDYTYNRIEDRELLSKFS